MAKEGKAPKPLGRPPKADKFDANLNFNCYRPLVNAVEAYRKREGLRSEAEACRQILERVLRREGLMEGGHK